MSHFVCLAVFLLIYAGIAVGSVPGLAIDRTGIAMLGAVVMVASGTIPLADALQSIDAPTMLLLLGFMIVSAQLQLSGFYTAVARRLGGVASRPKHFLAWLMAATAGLSAALVNDIVCLAFTPVVVALCRGAGLNPIPFLLGLAASSNIGSAATLVGNPQNMLIGQVGHLDFGHYLLWSLPVVLAALAMGYGLLVYFYRNTWRITQPAEKHSAENPETSLVYEWDRHQARKGLVCACVAVLLFFTPLPRDVVALTSGACLLCSRHVTTRRLLGLVDWHLMTLFCSLFVVVHAIAQTGLPAQALAWLEFHGVALANPFAMLGIATGLSNLVSNVPASVLLVKFLNPAAPLPWYVLALASTLAGNLLTIGSIANLIVIEQARQAGVIIRFREHARLGVPLTLLSLAVLAFWLLLKV